MRADLLAFLRSHPYAVQSSVSPQRTPQAAIVGVAVSDTFDIVFDTLRSSRKARNLSVTADIALTFGSVAADASRTVQVEGMADIIDPAGHEALVAMYLAAFPDGRERQRQPDLIYVRVRPRWLRDSDYGVTPPRIDEWNADRIVTDVETDEKRSRL